LTLIKTQMHKKNPLEFLNSNGFLKTFFLVTRYLRPL
jgi:hypothetical protein